jgi:hypothetical protein
MGLKYPDQHLNRGQTLIVVLYPRACNSFAKDAAIIPFPKEEVTPPVTKIYFVWFMLLFVL